MPENIIRTTNTAILVKVETTEGTDAAPGAVDAIPFEEGSLSYNWPYASDANNEANGSKVAGAPDMIGQPFEVSITVRLKGAGVGAGGASGYTSLVKPPHHALLAISGYRGLFTSTVAATALAAGGATSCTLGAPFSATADAYIGMPLILSGGVGAGAHPLIADYSAGKVATLTDSFNPVLDNTTLASIPANWTYAACSPRDAAARAVDEPSGTIYIYEDGKLYKGVGMRGMLEFSAATAKAGFATFKFMGVFAGDADAAIPAGIDVPGHSAPTLVQGPSGVTPAFSFNRTKLDISNFSLKDQASIEAPDDPNTAYGFGYGLIGGRSPMLDCDPLMRLKAVRDTLAELAAGTQFVGAVRFLGVPGNRMSICLTKAQRSAAQPGTRGQARSEQTSFRLMTSGRDANDRDTDKVICFY